MSQAQFWIVGGPNGAGKTTLAKHSRTFVPFMPVPLNPDAHSLGLLQNLGFSGFHDAPADILRDCFLQSARWVASEIATLLERGESVAVETVLSTEKYLPLFRQMAEHQGAFLAYVGNEKPEISIERVSFRVTTGGHDVPHDKIRARWHRSLELLPTFVQAATDAYIFDHSFSGESPHLIALKLNGPIHISPQSHPLTDSLIKSGLVKWAYQDLSNF